MRCERRRRAARTFRLRRGYGGPPKRYAKAVTVREIAILALLLLTAACASRTAPPTLPAVLKYADFIYPAVPQELQRTPGAERIDLGWRFLQNDDLRSADREFAVALKRSPALYPAQSGAAYVALARSDYDRALAAFDATLRTAPRYVPALVGRGQTLLALKRDEEALATFETAMIVDSTIPDLPRRIEVLRFRAVQDLIAAARAAAAAGRTADARVGYGRALKATPDTPFLYRELGLLERKDGNARAALDHFRRASELDPSDSTSLVQIAEILEQQQDFIGAEAVYRKAAAIDPSPELTARIAVIAERNRDARLPAEFRAIPTSPEITRGELAALIGVRLEPMLRNAPLRQEVLTDVAGHWAAPWINQVARAGVIEAFENHTFQPRARVRRGDLAAAVNRLVSLLAANAPDLRVRLTRRPTISDMSPAHLSYPAASVAVASGVLPLLPGDQFQVGRAVTGAEAVEAVERIRTLARTAR
jgi:Tfp pilus assembly protein PilF